MRYLRGHDDSVQWAKSHSPPRLPLITRGTRKAVDYEFFCTAEINSALIFAGAGAGPMAAAAATARTVGHRITSAAASFGQ